MKSSETKTDLFKRKLKIVLEKSSTGFSAYAPEEEGIYTVGETYEEVKENIAEVIEFKTEYLEEMGNSAEAERLRNADIEYFLDIQQFFEQYSMLNKSEFANFIGMNPSMMRKISKGLVSLSDAKARQIEEGLHRLADEFGKVNFA
ncbi:type II toxin-antitoxin system HicB family antitoxin [Aquiflexum lacus]|uniref:type II toxin-antitoxin system HicB family antitoxin n=1 Tax=Aquiflexum lacus TaxID=2483805 RepID=UPI0018930E8B|nr:type II toxin-antitoxin system HicB family antitoxin [Aquiflexum lacus]